MQAVRSGDHWKIYAGQALDTLDEAGLGVQIGPVNSGSSCCADDIYLTSDSQTKLQGLLNIAQHYGVMYRIKYGASKTNVTIAGSEIDRAYYQEICPWTMDGEKVNVVEDNDHLGQIVSGSQQMQKNVDQRLEKARKALYSLLDAGFAYKCFLCPALKLHLYRTFVCPVLRSGLSTFALRKKTLNPSHYFKEKH